MVLCAHKHKNKSILIMKISFNDLNLKDQYYQTVTFSSNCSLIKQKRGGTAKLVETSREQQEYWEGDGLLRMTKKNSI